MYIVGMKYISEIYYTTRQWLHKQTTWNAAQTCGLIECLIDK